MVNEQMLRDALVAALEADPHPDLDEAWLAWVMGNDWWICCLHGPEGIRQAATQRMLDLLR
jgi:hypothetical protein